jgi:DNA-binding MarR family transcriptional regulator
MSEPRWLTDTEQRMWRALHSLGPSLERVLEQSLDADAGLSGADFAVLVPLSEAPERQLRARDLGLTMGWDRSRLSHQIRRMEQRGLLVRTNCPTDARGTFIELTPLGWQTIEAAAPAHVETVRRYVFDALTADEVLTLTALAEKLGERLGKPGLELCDGTGDSQADDAQAEGAQGDGAQAEGGDCAGSAAAVDTAASR